ncbi:capsular polysaccharide synthesis protein [Domibacillus sp.]|uniref:glycosyltransferase family 32 protein n=1 Tax=Domibacillus sp. TaxID=1969783 RepID=UPI0028125A1D|nr:capsular polysaccharide synthesis protein [Domibacillus sp.]
MNENKKIPKRIHYCWFGGKEKPEIVERCIRSWKTYLPDYEITEWNEQNTDVNSSLYMKQAYEAGKFAFVSDYVRVHALYQYGGIYLDTDVEVFKSFDDLLHHESFWGFEQENFIATSTIGAQKKNPLIKVFLDSYKDKPFLKKDGTFDALTNVAIVTQILQDFGLKKNGEKQELIGLGTFYPQAYFSPYDYINCRDFHSDYTYTKHYFFKSWLPPKARLKSHLKKVLAKAVGGHTIAKLRSLTK